MEFINNPNIPDNCINYVIADYRLNKQSVKSLRSLGIYVIPTIKINTLQPSVCGHADMMIHHIGGNRFIAAAEAYEHFKTELPTADIIKGSKRLISDYPGDILYNCAVFGNYVICNAAYTATEILSEYLSAKRSILNVRQGYSKCSICIVNKNAVITADKNIAKICADNKIDVLKISPGYIELKGMDYGFIGGASGLIAENILAVNGELKTHPDNENIISFCKNHSVDIYELKKGTLTDIGSIIPIF